MLYRLYTSLKKIHILAVILVFKRFRYGFTDFSDSDIFYPRCRESGTMLSKLLKLGHNKNYETTSTSCMATLQRIVNAKCYQLYACTQSKVKLNRRCTTFC